MFGFVLFHQHFQNFQLLGAWCLLNSLFLILNLSPTALADKGKEKDPLAALRVRDILSRTKEGVGSPKLGPGKGYVSASDLHFWMLCRVVLVHWGDELLTSHQSLFICFSSVDCSQGLCMLNTLCTKDSSQPLAPASG